ncbi:hypothetical protein HOK51_11460 [Candidatus Woesearchaeota archaeon]|jgi:hypothetical protein|nr:hypothetical protein [Candidatus Woesearchaeota archaeon]
MKKERFCIFGVLLLLLIILFSISVSANIYLDSFFKSEYNKGDELLAKGHIVLEKDLADAIFSIVLSCDNDVTLVTRYFDLEASNSQSFEELISIPNSVNGACNLLFVLDGDGTADSESSDTFTVLSEMDGSLELEPAQIQLGEHIQIIGDFDLKDGTPVDGNAVISVKQGDKVFSMKNKEIIGGKLDHSFGPLFIPSGQYTLEVEVNDAKGNQGIFRSQFKASNKIIINAELDKSQVKPGSQVHIVGSIEQDVGTNKESTEIDITFENKTETINVFETFSHTLDIFEDISTGLHELTIKATDDSGNKGLVIFDINILPNPTMKNVFSETSFEPPAMLTFYVDLYDQTAEQLQGSIEVNLVNEDNEVLFEGFVQAREEINYDFERGYAPTKIILETFYDGLSDRFEFIVEEYRKIDFVLDGAKVKVENVGNVNYKDYVNITLVGEEKTFVINEKVSLAPGEFLFIDLEREVPGASYDVLVPQDGQIFRNISITDKRPVYKKSFSEQSSGVQASFIILFVLIPILIISIILFIIYRKKIINWFMKKLKKPNPKHKLLEGIKYTDKIEMPKSKVDKAKAKDSDEKKKKLKIY